MSSFICYLFIFFYLFLPFSVFSSPFSDSTEEKTTYICCNPAYDSAEWTAFIQELSHHSKINEAQLRRIFDFIQKKEISALQTFARGDMYHHMPQEGREYIANLYLTRYPHLPFVKEFIATIFLPSKAPLDVPYPLFERGMKLFGEVEAQGMLSLDGYWNYCSGMLAVDCFADPIKAENIWGVIKR